MGIRMGCWDFCPAKDMRVRSAVHIRRADAGLYPKFSHYQSCVPHVYSTRVFSETCIVLGRIRAVQIMSIYFILQRRIRHPSSMILFKGSFVPPSPDGEREHRVYLILRRRIIDKSITYAVGKFRDALLLCTIEGMSRRADNDEVAISNLNVESISDMAYPRRRRPNFRTTSDAPTVTFYLER